MNDKITTVTHDGQVYQIDQEYFFSNDGNHLVYGRLTSIGFNEATGKTLAVALIQIAKQQGVHPMEYFEINETSIKLAENTYKAINKIRPKGNLIGLTVSKTNRQSKIANAIRP